MGGTEIIIPYDLTIALGLIVIKCVDTKNYATQKFTVKSVETEEEELPGIEITE